MLLQLPLHAVGCRRGASSSGRSSSTPSAPRASRTGPSPSTVAPWATATAPYHPSWLRCLPIRSCLLWCSAGCSPGCRRLQSYVSQAAIDKLKRALDLLPQDSDAWYSLGVLLSDQGRKDEAVAAYTRSVTINAGCRARSVLAAPRLAATVAWRGAWLWALATLRTLVGYISRPVRMWQQTKAAVRLRQRRPVRCLSTHLDGLTMTTLTMAILWLYSLWLCLLGG